MPISIIYFKKEEKNIAKLANIAKCLSQLGKENT